MGLRTFQIEIEPMRSPASPLALLIEDWRIAISSQLADDTVTNYMQTMCHLDALMGHPMLGEFTLDAVARAVATKRRTSVSSARLIAAVARSFANSQTCKRIWNDNGRSVLEHLGVPRFNGRRDGFSDAEYLAIRKALNALPNRTRLRDRAVALMTMGCGIRARELRLLDITNVHIRHPLSESWVFIEWDTAKGKQQRKVRMDPQVASSVHAYIAQERPEADGALFLRRGGEGFSRYGFQGYLGRIADSLERAGIRDWGAHRGRHQWATDGARNGMTESELGLEGGWAEGSPTPRHYVHRARMRFEDLQRKPTAMSSLVRSA